MPGDNIRQKFTGYQKDTETSLDFAEARMYENRFGRFTAVDPLLASGKSANPQTFNRFIYVSNNPIMLSDPSGLDPWWKRSIGNNRYEYKESKDSPDGKDWEKVDFGNSYYTMVSEWNDTGRTAFLYSGGGQDFGQTVARIDDLAKFFATYGNSPKELAIRNPQVRDAATDVMWMGAAIANKPSETYNFAAWGANKFGAGLPYAPTIEPDENTRTGGKIFYYGTNGALILEGGISLFRGVRGFFGKAGTVEKEVYSLRAAKDGMYPVMKRGFADPVGEVFLKRGDVWKYGETMNPATRYPQSFLKNTGGGLRYFPEGFKTTNFKAAFQFQKQKITNYERIFGQLPPGNKIKG